jgi:hypothetical protein
MKAHGRWSLAAWGAGILLGVSSCGSSSEAGDDFPKPLDPDNASIAEVDRFSEAAATIFKRAENAALPASGEPVDFDEVPFVTLGFGPAGEHIRYYHFDVRDEHPAPMYVLIRDDTNTAVPGQLPIVDVLPGSDGYNDFFRIHHVKVPASYRPNALTSLEQIRSLGLETIATDQVVNRPIVPEGSSAALRLADQESAPRRLWYRGEVAFAFAFEDRVLTSTAIDGTLLVGLSTIFVTFNVNPDQPGGGPCSGVMTETDTGQSHNVVAAMPPDPEYSPLWNVFAYDNADFDTVYDLDTAQAATIVPGVAAPNVNCPIVEIAP